jgi:uncharacterized protein (DUF111 family)
MKTGLVQSESTTPTGAAILRAMVDKFTDNHSIIIDKIGYGLGTKDFEVPNVLRVYLGEVEDTLEEEKQFIIETNIDDMNPEIFEFIEKKLFKIGVLDVYKTPIIMKKGRLATKLSILFTAEHRFSVQHILFTETSTAGIREYEVKKTVLQRSFRTIETEYGTVRMKDLFWQGKFIKTKAEYDDCKKLAIQHQVAIQTIYDAIKRKDTHAK